MDIQKKINLDLDLTPYAEVNQGWIDQHSYAPGVSGLLPTPSPSPIGSRGGVPRWTAPSPASASEAAALAPLPLVLWPSVWSFSICVLSWGTVMHGRDGKLWLHVASIQLPSHSPGHGLFRTRGPSLEKVGAWRKGVCCVTGWLCYPSRVTVSPSTASSLTSGPETDPVYPCE